MRQRCSQALGCKLLSKLTSSQPQAPWSACAADAAASCSYGTDAGLHPTLPRRPFRRHNPLPVPQDVSPLRFWQEQQDKWAGGVAASPAVAAAADATLPAASRFYLPRADARAATSARSAAHSSDDASAAGWDSSADGTAAVDAARRATMEALGSTGMEPSLTHTVAAIVPRLSRRMPVDELARRVFGLNDLEERFPGFDAAAVLRSPAAAEMLQHPTHSVVRRMGSFQQAFPRWDVGPAMAHPLGAAILMDPLALARCLWRLEAPDLLGFQLPLQAFLHAEAGKDLQAFVDRPHVDLLASARALDTFFGPAVAAQLLAAQRQLLLVPALEMDRSVALLRRLLGETSTAGFTAASSSDAASSSASAGALAGTEFAASSVDGTAAPAVTPTPVTSSALAVVAAAAEVGGALPLLPALVLQLPGLLQLQHSQVSERVEALCALAQLPAPVGATVLGRAGRSVMASSTARATAAANAAAAASRDFARAVVRGAPALLLQAPEDAQASFAALAGALELTWLQAAGLLRSCPEALLLALPGGGVDAVVGQVMSELGCGSVAELRARVLVEPQLLLQAAVAAVLVGEEEV